MSAKVTIPGNLFKRFFNDPEYWPEDGGDTFYDDVLLSVNGITMPDGVSAEDLQDTDVVVVEYGGVVEGRGDGVGFDDYYLQWLGAQTNVSFLVSCPREKEAELKAAILAMGLGASVQ